MGLGVKFLTKKEGYKQFGYFCPMKLLGRIFDFYLDASIHVALAIISLLWATLHLLDIPKDRHLDAFVFFSSIACYNFIKYGVEVEKYLGSTNPYRRYIQYLSLMSLGMAVYHMFFLDQNTILTIIVLGIVTGFYALPVLPGTQQNLRSLAGFKIFPVAVVWAGTTVLLPVVALGLGITWDVWVEAIQRFVLVLVLLIPFEIRDMNYDPPEMKTWPHRYGVPRTKALGVALIILFFFLTFLKDTITVQEIGSKAVLLLGLGGVLMATRKDQTKYFSAFWVESVPIFWYVLMWYFGGGGLGFFL